MRRADKELLSPEEQLAILREAPVCRLAMTDGDEPYLVPMNFVYEDGALYLHSAPTGRKMELLAHHPKVCVQADVGVRFVSGGKPCACTMHYRSVIAMGRAFVVEDPQAKLHALEILAAKYTGTHEPIPPAAAAKVAVIRVEIISMTGKLSPAP